MNKAEATSPNVESSENGNPQPSYTNKTEIEPYRVVEAILMASDVPMPPPKIAAILGIGTAKDVRKHIDLLNSEYEASGRSFRIVHIAGGYQILTLPVYNGWLQKLHKVRQETKLSAAALETLAIVAYKQPCTRADVEAIRGVALGDLLNRLREMNLIKIVGRAEDLGRPMLYGTTKRFLETFGLPSLEELPQVEALQGGATHEKPDEDPAGSASPPSNTDSDGDQDREPTPRDSTPAEEKRPSRTEKQSTEPSDGASPPTDQPSPQPSTAAATSRRNTCDVSSES